MPAAKNPSVVKIGPQTFDIEYRTSKDDGMLNDGAHGYTLDEGNLIVVSADVPLSKQKVILMHEILHAMRMVFDNNPPKKESEYEDWEHYFIGIFENSILMFMDDNPTLVEWFNG